MATLRKGCLLLSLARGSKLRSCFRLGRNINTSPVVSYWNKDWKPGPIPRTPEERAAAAKKYGLRPEDYNALTDGELGDYPNLPLVSKVVKDPWADYDVPGDKRDFGEPIHPDSDIIGRDLWDSKSDGIYTYWQALFRALLIGGGFVTLFVLCQPYPFFLPQMPKQYPFNDLYLERGGDSEQEPEIKHYTFDPK